MGVAIPRSAGVRLRLGTFLVQICDSRTRVILASVVFGLIGAAAEFIIHNLILATVLSSLVHSALDAVSVGVAMAAATGAVLWATRERRKQVLEEMSRVAELNHQVRNALQIIAHSHFGPPSEHATMVLQSVERIEKTLKALFPTATHPHHKR